MKRIILVLITIFSLNVVAYASFPVAESPTEQLSVLNTISPVVSDDGWGLAALCCGILSLLLFSLPLLGTCAIIFGAIGLSNGGGSMSSWGLILGIIKFIAYLIFIFYFLGSASYGIAGAAFGG